MSLRVLIADDSSLARAMLREILESDSDIVVVGEARDGFEAVDMANRLSPDIVTMDLRMPVLDGLGAITEIMSTKPLPILVVSSAADAEDAYVAVQRGALETLAKPDFSESARVELVAKVKNLARAKVLTHLRPGQILGKSQSPSRLPKSPDTGGSRGTPVFGIASSTGGPQALARILSSLPHDFPGPILIAQHISDGFAPGLVQWLSTVCKLQVKLASDGELPLPAKVYVSPSESNLSLSATGRVALLEPEERQIFHPVCDVLFSSIAAACGARGHGIILTGMSEDGVRGIGDIRKAGGRTLAQDEASSVVFGMNRLAIERGAIGKVLPLDEIPGEMLRIAALAGAEA